VIGLEEPVSVGLAVRLTSLDANDPHRGFSFWLVVIVRAEVLILGSSVRAAAQSAARAGFAPRMGDDFADQDARPLGPITRLEPARLVEQACALAAQSPGIPWFYTGPFENRPELVAAVSRTCKLWGSSAADLAVIRDPIRLSQVLARAGLNHPRATRDPTGLPCNGSWLVKPLRSGGGRGIQPWLGGPLPAEPVYFQQRIPGKTYAAIYLAARNQARLLGSTRQWLGSPTARFAYRGSLGPWPFHPSILGKLETLGQTLAQALPLRGWFGVDFILNRGAVFPVEINPRYTASVEILEDALGLAFLPWHRTACEEDRLPEVDHRRLARPRFFAAKRVLYARQDLIAPQIKRPDYEPKIPGDPPRAADIPAPGTEFRRGEPVLTVLARAATIETCRRLIHHRERDWRHRLEGPLRPLAPHRGEIPSCS